jgi:hypothetical protein
VKRKIKLTLVALTLVLGAVGAASAPDRTEAPDKAQKTLACDAGWCHG